MKVNDQFVTEIKYLLVKLDSTQYYNFNDNINHEWKFFSVSACKFKTGDKVQIFS